MCSIFKEFQKIAANYDGRFIDVKTILENPRRGYLLARGCLKNKSAVGLLFDADQKIKNAITEKFLLIGCQVQSLKPVEIHKQATKASIVAKIKPPKAKEWAAFDVVPLDHDQFMDSLKGGQKWIMEAGQIALAAFGLLEGLTVLFDKSTGQTGLIEIIGNESEQIKIYKKIQGYLLEPPRLNDHDKKYFDCNSNYFNLGCPDSVSCRNCERGLYRCDSGWLCALPDIPCAIPDPLLPCKKHIFNASLMPWPIVLENENSISYSVNGGEIWNISDEIEAETGHKEKLKYTSRDLCGLSDAAALLGDELAENIRQKFDADILTI